MPLGTQPSLLQSPLTETQVALDKPQPRPRVEARDADCLARAAYLPEVLPKGGHDMLFGVYQDWVHQNSGNYLDSGIKEDGKWKSR